MDEQQGMQQPVSSTGPITIEDVRAALGDTSPMDTNAGKVRAILSRGSLGTIQKHLEALRAQRIAAAQPAAELNVPKAPAEAVEILWAAAWGAAQTKTLARLESLSAERDRLLMQAQAQAEDIVSLTEQLDTLEASFQVQTEALRVAQQSAKDALQAQADELAVTKAALVKAQSEAEHAAALAERDAKIERQTMQMTIGRLTEQLSEVRALHIVQATKGQPAESTEVKKK